MTTPSALSAEVREALAGATQYPWRVCALSEGYPLIQDANGYRFAQVDDDGNRRLIAHAPEWLASLCYALDATRAELAEWKDHAEKQRISLEGCVRSACAEKDKQWARADAAVKLCGELVEKWREAHYHWSLEFGKVTDRWEDWVPDGEGADDLLKRAAAIGGDLP